MRIPKSLRIRKSNWVVKLDASEMDTNKHRGECDINLRKICIDPGMSKREQEETFIHEWLHATFPDGIVGFNKEEVIVEQLSKTLYASLIDSGLTIVKARGNKTGKTTKAHKKH